LISGFDVTAAPLFMVWTRHDCAGDLRASSDFRWTAAIAIRYRSGVLFARPVDKSAAPGASSHARQDCGTSGIQA